MKWAVVVKGWAYRVVGVKGWAYRVVGVKGWAYRVPGVKGYVKRASNLVHPSEGSSYVISSPNSLPSIKIFLVINDLNPYLLVRVPHMS